MPNPPHHLLKPGIHLAGGMHGKRENGGVLSGGRECERGDHIEGLSGKAERTCEAEHGSALGIRHSRMQHPVTVRGEDLIESPARFWLDVHTVRFL